MTDLLEFRVIQGSQAGASLIFEKNGRYLLGAGDHCDVVVSSDGISLEHAYIQLTDEGFTVLSPDEQRQWDEKQAQREARLFEDDDDDDDDEDEDEDREKDPFVASDENEENEAETVPEVVPYGDIVQLGDLIFTVQDARAPWLTTQEVIARLREKAQHKLAEETQSEKTERVPQKSIWTLKRLLLLGVFFIFSAFAGGVAAVWHLGGFDAKTINNSVQVSEEVVRAVKTVLSRYGYNDRIEIKPQKDKLILSGYLMDQIQVRTLTKALARWEDKIEMQVFSESALLLAARNSVAKNTPYLRADIGYQGRIFLNGLLVDPHNTAMISKRLSQEVPHLKGVDFKIMSFDQVRALVYKWLSDKKFPASMGLSVARINEQAIEKVDELPIALSGKLPHDQLPLLLEWLSAEALRKMQLIYIKTNIQEAPLPPTVSSRVRVVGRGEVPYVLLDTGELVLIGGIVDGMMLKEINDTGAVFAQIN